MESLGVPQLGEGRQEKDAVDDESIKPFCEEAPPPPRSMTGSEWPLKTT